MTVKEGNTKTLDDEMSDDSGKPVVYSLPYAVDADAAAADANVTTIAPTPALGDNTCCLWGSAAFMGLYCMGRPFTVRHCLISSCGIVIIIIAVVSQIVCWGGNKNACDVADDFDDNDGDGDGDGGGGGDGD
mmetsp:Transcript_17305/g.19006  ORF Transcript_17305/g.19006 Transcript_17305/m.19006 type:complete len:132 (+) Transcript_17305:240-635(+)